MTALTVLEQIEALKKEEDYAGIISLTEGLDPTHVSLPIKFEMIAAYLNRNEEDDQKKAFDILRETDHDFHGMPVWLYLVSGFRIHIEEPYHALSMLENFTPEVVPETQAKAIRSLYDFACQMAASPFLKMPVVKVIKEAWDNFIEAEPKILKALEAGDHNEANIATMMAFSSITSENLLVLLEKDVDQPVLIFSPRGFRHMIPIVQLVIALAPESVKAKYRLCEGLPPSRGFELPKPPAGHASPITFAVTQENGFYCILVSAPVFAKMGGDMGHPIIHGMVMSLQRSVGEAAFIDCFKTGRIVNEIPEDADVLSPEEVVTFVKSRVPNWETLTLGEIYDESVESSFPIKPQSDDFMSREDDVLWSTTHIPYFLQEHADGEARLSVDFEDLGVSVGYFAFRTQKGIEADKVVLERLIDEMKAHPLLGTVIGHAHGQTRVYLDVMIYDPEPFANWLKDFFAKIEEDEGNALIDLAFRRWLSDVYGWRIVGDVPMSLTRDEQNDLLHKLPKLDPAKFRATGDKPTTAEETLAAAEAAYEENNLMQVRLLVSHMSPADMTSRAKLLLCIAQIMTLDRDHKDAARVMNECFDVLLSLKDEYGGTLDYEGTLGLMYFFRGEEGLALQHIDAAMQLADGSSKLFTEEHLKIVHDRAKRILMNPKFGMHFFEKCRVFFNFLNASHYAIIEGLESDDEKLATQMANELKDFLDLMFPRIDIRIEKIEGSEDQIVVVIDAHDDQTVAMEASMMMAVAPNNNRHGWSIRLDGIQTDASGRYEPTEHMHYVQLDPNDITSHRLRMDMTKAYTMTPELWLDYHNGVDTHADHLHRHGIAPMMLVIPNSGFIDEKRLAELDRLATAIVIDLGDNVAQYTGKALGLHHDYLDFFVADTVKFLKVVKEIFEREGLSNTRYQIFRFGVDPMPLTFEIAKSDETVPSGTLLN